MKFNFTIVLFTIFFGIFNCFSQTKTEIDPNNLNQSLLNSLFLKELNKYRENIHLTKLQDHSILNKAAQDQSNYMSIINELTHDQTKPSKKQPSDRVLYYLGNFNSVGENVLFVFFDESKENTPPSNTSVKTYEDLATAMFINWKNSPPHHKNMIHADYRYSGIAITYQAKNKKIFAAQVFSGEEYHPPSFFPKDFSMRHIKWDDTGIYKEVADMQFSISTANFIYQSPTDSTAMNYYDIREVKPILNKPFDGIMVDYVIREQFTCKSENILDFSPVYDGWTQEPVFTPELYSKNKAKSKGELDVNLSKIPPAILDKNYNANIILIKDKLAINYTIPLSVPQSNFKVLNFKPLIDVSDTKITDTTFVFHFTNRVYFEKGTAIPLEDDFYEGSLLYNNYLPKDSKLKHVQVVGYSSIEGDSLQNSILQQKRVNYLNKLLLDQTNLSPNLISTQTTSNKKDFYRDFGKTLLLKPNLPLSELNKIYSTNKDKIDENILALHRYTELNYDLELSLNNFSSLKTIEFIYEHIIELNSSAKNKLLKVILARLQKGEELSFLDPVDFRSVTNKNLLLPLYFYVSDSVKFRELYFQIKKNKNWTEKDRFNFVISNYKYYDTYSKPFIPLTELVSSINGVSNKTISDTVKNLLWLNYYLILTHYNYDIKNVSEMKNALQNFRTYYFKFDQTLDDIIQIGLFFNCYAMFDWTFDLLKPKLDKYPKNERLWFTYLNTYTFAEYGNFDDVFLQKLISNCKKMNKPLFCKWINEDDFQLLRHPLIKTNYCNDCEK